jgi:hypothetical protein
MQTGLKISRVETNYKHPPIKVRSFEASARLESSDFERFAPAWLQQVASTQTYPKQELRQHWDFFIRQNRDGVPIPKGVLTNVPRLYAEASNGLISRSIDLYPPKKRDETAKIVFVLYRPTRTVTRYTQLRNEVAKWLPDWMDSVHSSGLGGIRLRYDNEVPQKEYPTFWGEQGLSLGQILNFFSKNPAPLGKFHPPFRTELNLIVDESVPVYMRTAFVSELPDKNTFRVTFEYISNRKTLNRSVEDCLSEMDQGHNLILEHFEKHFTKGGA